MKPKTTPTSRSRAHSNPVGSAGSGGEQDLPPTSQYQVLQAAFDHFNKELFGGQLPHVMLTMDRSRRRARGVFSWDRFGSRSSQITTHEISLNPNEFGNTSDEDILSTLVHEMVHLWQHEFGRCGRNAYHNKEWAAKMESLGLMATDTGELGGKQTGNSVTHIIVDGGAFQVSARTFLVQQGIAWQDMRRSGSPTRKVSRKQVERAKRMKVTHLCPRCGQKAEAADSAVLVCGVCMQRMKVS